MHDVKMNERDSMEPMSGLRDDFLIFYLTTLDGCSIDAQTDCKMLAESLNDKRFLKPMNFEISDMSHTSPFPSPTLYCYD